MITRSYPQGWSEFLDLRAERETFWINIPRAEYDAHPARKHRKIYHDINAGVYYLVDTILNTDHQPIEDFFEQCHLQRNVELSCYTDSKILGYCVADPCSTACFNDTSISTTPCYFNMIATKAIAGPSIAALQKSTNPQVLSIIHEAFIQSVVFGITLADRDRANVANIILVDHDYIQPTLCHIDFEEAGKTTLDRLFEQLDANYQFDLINYDWRIILDRCRTLHNQCNTTQIPFERQTLYKNRLASGIDYITQRFKYTS